jgi:hypothetical protein
MVPQQAQRLRWEDDVDIFLRCDKGRVLMMTNRFYFYLSLPQLWWTRIHLFFSFIFRQLICFYCSLYRCPTTFSLTDPPFLLFCILVRLVPLPNAIKPLNNWVRLGQCSLVIATLDSICITVELMGNLWMIFLPLKNA